MTGQPRSSRGCLGDAEQVRRVVPALQLHAALVVGGRLLWLRTYALPRDASSRSQPVTRSTSTATTGPFGGVIAYCCYFAWRASSAATRSERERTTRPVPSARTHHSRPQSSLYSSTRIATDGFVSMLRSRCRRRDRFGFSSTTQYATRPPSRSSNTNTSGTTCGEPSGVTVASRPTRAARSRGIASPSST